MKERECEGELKFHSGGSSRAKLVSLASKGRAWLRARGHLYLPLEYFPSHDPGKWQIGMFTCKKIQHKSDNDVFLISATDDGQIFKDQDTKYEERVIEVSILRFSPSDTSRNDKPHVYKYGG